MRTKWFIKLLPPFNKHILLPLKFQKGNGPGVMEIAIHLKHPQEAYVYQT